MSNLGEKYLNDHKNPITRLPQQGSKLFKPQSSDFSSDLVENLKKILEQDKVEKKCFRSKAEWVKSEELAKITKIQGQVVSHFGFENKNGKFLHPEEALFLLETNRLELICDEIPIHIEQAYNMLLNNSKSSNIARYKAYKTLAIQGYKLSKSRKNQKNCNSKRKMIDNDPEIQEKICKVDCSNDFGRLKELGPRVYDITNFQGHQKNVPDYFVHLPNNSAKNPPDFNLFLCDVNQDVDFSGNEKDIFAICSSNNVSFYHFYNINLPDA